MPCRHHEGCPLCHCVLPTNKSNFLSFDKKKNHWHRNPPTIWVFFVAVVAMNFGFGTLYFGFGFGIVGIVAVTLVVPQACVGVQREADLVGD